MSDKEGLKMALFIGVLLVNGGQLALIFMKTFGAINWEWFYVFLPFTIEFVIITILLIVAVILGMKEE